MRDNYIAKCKLLLREPNLNQPPFFGERIVRELYYLMYTNV